MTSRERTLIGAVAAAGALWFGSQGLTRYREAVARNQNVQTAAEAALSEGRVAQLRGQRARKMLSDWRNQSLPTDQQVAESLYQDWLRAQATGAGMAVTQLTDKSGATRNPQFGEAAVESRADGTLAQLANFLYRFYTAPHLHRISNASITAADGGQKLSLVITATALILPDSRQSDALADGEPQPIDGVKSLEEIRQRLVDRNLFVAHTPKSQVAVTTDGGAAEAIFSATYYGLDGWQMGVRNKTSGSVAYYKKGDAVAFGEMKGKVVEIEARRVVIETGKGRVELLWGQNFSEATPLAPPAA